MTKADVTIFRNGQEVNTRLDKDTQKELLRRISILFNKNTADTSSVWYRNEAMKDGMDLDQKWEHLLQGSYYYVTIPERRILSKSTYKRADIAEVIVTIVEDHNDNVLGDIYAKLRDGEVRAYRHEGMNKINLYCYDEILQYLPIHYSTLNDKYSAPEYENSGINCSGKLSLR